MRALGLCLVVAVGVIGGAPIAALDHAVARSSACLSAYEDPREGELPACEGIDASLSLAALAPWTRRSALRVREELAVREASARYLDAAVATPDPAALAARHAALRPAREALHEGTGRLRVDELGAPLPAPDPVTLAARVGDRKTLLAAGPRYRHWYEAVAAIEAAILEGEHARAETIGLAYVDDPHDAMRVRAGALACLAGEHERAIEALSRRERSRAEKRDADYARDFGDLRSVIEACAALAGSPPPAPPHPGDAGLLDQRERVLVARLHGAELRARCQPPQPSEAERVRCLGAPEVAAAIGEIRTLLEGEGVAHRAVLAAAIAWSFDDADAANDLARPRTGELASDPPLGIGRWIGGPPAGAPLLAPDRHELAARRFGELAAGTTELERTAGVAWLHAASGYAARGELDDARRCAEAGAPLVWRDAAGRALALAHPLWAAGDRPGALAVLERVGVEPVASRASPAAAELALVRAELAALLNRPAKEHAADAFERASTIGGDRIAARWLALALDAEPAFEPWSAWLGGNAAQRRAARYRAYRERDTIPAAARLPALHVAARLADGHVETWLDAFEASDTRTLTLRERAFFRAEAARWRGDDAAAAGWWRRYRELAALGQTLPQAELWRAVGL